MAGTMRRLTLALLCATYLCLSLIVALTLWRNGGGWGAGVAALVGSRVHDHFAYEWGVTGVETTAAEAWAAVRGVCQDYAHCMVAISRLCGLPARYVSGHLLGDGGTHAWVEVLVQDDAGCSSRQRGAHLPALDLDRNSD